MSAKKPSDRERLESLAARLTAERASIDAQIPELEAQELELRREAIRATGERSDTKGVLSSSAKVARKRKRLEEAIPALDAELAAVALELEAARDQENAERFAAAISGFAEFDEREQAAIDALKACYMEFEDLVGALRSIQEERAHYGADFRFDEQAQADEFRAKATPLWNPPPASVEDAFERVWNEGRKASQPEGTVVASHNPILEPIPPVPERKPSYLPGWGPHHIQRQKDDAVHAILDAAGVPR